ncbi:MAG: hypothetical protein DWQ47_06705 [Acidobacteria bacterium]|nr:MAG: hypothetical protein DWQ32_10255 [Acidobacteriota bacterium]REK02064.1 MAG: hypothetical protein DWQ38_06685 [Acidobacteriota bacterium]REK15022.1 MAG: hypothetical protein DWQ43_15945 [Acidobacteriota bacterium]REK45736.1 MAG: hypothetical protein DWQ47_06705 [Acidobacteriota bacterium]
MRTFFNFTLILSILSVIALLSSGVFAQSPQTLKRTTYKTETVEAGVGTTVSIIGSPVGAIRIEGWNRNEIEISAEIEVTASNESDLAELSKVTGFLVDQGLTKTNIVTVGPHDKKYLKKAAKGFPKRLRNSPFTIDYTLKVPVYTDFVIDGGRGDFFLRGVEGSMRIKFLESKAEMMLTGGSIQATFGVGDVNVTMLKPSWRGRFAEVQVASGTLNVLMPRDMNANLIAEVLRTGTIENGFENIKPVRLTKFSESFMDSIVGNGGARMRFTVGDGSLVLSHASKPEVAEKQP